MGKANSRKFFCNTDGKKFQIGNACSLTENKDYSCLCMWTIQNWLGRNKTLTQCGNYSRKKSIWANKHLFLTTYFWDAQENVKSIMNCGKQHRYVRIQDFCWSQGETTYPELQGNLMQTQYLLGPMTWKVTQRNAWKDIVNLRIKQLSNHTKSRRHASMTINLEKEKVDQLENCPQFAHNLF